MSIASYEDMKAHTLAIARGRLKPKAHEPKVWFTSTESFAKVLSNKNRALDAGSCAPQAAPLLTPAPRQPRRRLQ